MDQPVEPLDAFKAAVADRYAIERELGRGGMATVYLARDLKLGRPVAIKVLKPELAAALGATRFLREIEIASRLSHPQLLPLYDSGEAAGSLYYVMPYIDGWTLREKLRRERQLTFDEARSILCDVAEGVEYAHQHGVIHRDIKPENVLLHGGRALLADFGIARAITAAAREPLTSSGVIVGTVQYMSPEQALGERELDARSDIYSLGCLLYEMLAGEPPFSGPSVQSIIARHVSAGIPSLHLVRPDLPEEIDESIRRAIAKVPAARFPSAAAFAASIRACGTGRTKKQVAVRRIALLGGVSVILAAAAVLTARELISGPLREHDWVLVADFEGPVEDPRLAVAFRDLVTVALQQSRYVRILDRRQLNEVMRHAAIPETTYVDAKLARQLALRSSVRAVLLGSIQPLGADYSVVLHVVSAEDGTALASAAGTVRGSDWQQQLITAAEQRVRELRERLGERRRAISANRPLRDVATPSFEAFTSYSAALDRIVMYGDFIGSNQLLAEAIQQDSGFASAWIVLGSNYLSARQLDSARWAYEKALSLPQRLADAETYRLKGDVAYALDYDVAGAIRWYDLYLVEVPHSRSGRSNRAFYRSALGDYQRAVRDLEEAVAGNPFGPELIQPVLLNLAALYVVLGRNRDARRTSQQLSGPFADYIQILLATAEARWSDAERIAAAVTASDSAIGVFRINAATSLAGALAARGAVQAADSLLEAMARSSRGSAARWYERARLLLAIAEGKIPPRADILPLDTTAAADMLRAMWAAASGDTLSAQRWRERLPRLSTRDVAVIGTGPLVIESWIAATGARWREVVDALGSVAVVGEHDPSILDRPDSFILRWPTAIAYERLGRSDSAAVYLNLILRPTRIPPGHYALRGLSHRIARERLQSARDMRSGITWQPAFHTEHTE